VVSVGVQSNASDFIVVKAVDMTPVCSNPKPSSVAIADQISFLAITQSLWSVIRVQTAYP